MKYEYGYILAAGGETQTTVLGFVDESDLPAKTQEIEAANRAERAIPNIRGHLVANPALYFVRPAPVGEDVLAAV